MNIDTDTDIKITIEESYEMSKKTINFVKWWLKELKDILSQYKCMSNTVSEDVAPLLHSIDELYDLSHRKNMTEHIYMFSRRQKAVKSLALLDLIKSRLTPQQYEEAKKTN